eukprot:2257958-Amphidinium_carterae.1
MKETQFMDENMERVHKKFGIYLPTQHQPRQLQDDRATSATASEATRGKGRGKRGYQGRFFEVPETTPPQVVINNNGEVHIM